MLFAILTCSKGSDSIKDIAQRTCSIYILSILSLLLFESRRKTTSTFG